MVKAMTKENIFKRYISIIVASDNSSKFIVQFCIIAAAICMGVFLISSIFESSLQAQKLATVSFYAAIVMGSLAVLLMLIAFISLNYIDDKVNKKSR